MEESSSPLNTRHLIVKMTYANQMEVTAIARDLACITKEGTYYSDQQEGDVTTTFSKESIEQLTTEGIISPDISIPLLSIFEHKEKVLNSMKLTEQNQSSYEKNLNLKELENEIQQDNTLQLNAIRQLLATQSMSSSKIPDEFYYHIDQENCFGVLKVLAERLRFIPELLKNSEVIHLPNEGASRYSIRSSKELNKDIGDIGLSYDFTLAPDQTIKEAFEQYIDDMEPAIKVLLAYWATANEMGNFQFLTPITTIMAMMKNENRKSSISSSEKKRFWALSKLLANTKFFFKCKIANVYVNINAPLLDLSITASFSKDQEIKNGYPDKIMPHVLSPGLKEAALNVTEISKGTLKLTAESIFLHLYPQIRASQNRNKKPYTEIDEEYAMELAGLSRTYKTNKRMARKILKEKLKIMDDGNATSKHEVNEKISINKKKGIRNKEQVIKMYFREPKGTTKKRTKNIT